MKSVLFFLALFSHQLIAQQNDVDPQSNFALIKNLTQIVVQPQESQRIPLDEVFRGQLLKYSWNLTYQNGTPVVFNASAEPLVQVTEPLQLLSNNELFDGRTNQQSLPQTSLLYTDKYQNRFLILVDYKMNLQIHNITNFYVQDQTLLDLWINRPIITNLYQTGQSLSDEKSCNNLVLLDQNTLMANCKSDVKALNAISVSIFIDISKMRSRVINMKYQISGYTYDLFKDGAIISAGANDEGYLLLQKPNATTCSFSLHLLTYDTLFDHYVINFREFKDPLKNDPQLQSQLTSTQKGEQNTQKSRREIILGQTEQGCGNPEPIDFETPYIKYLQIRDVKILPYFSDIIVASDYNYGLLFWRFQCFPLHNCSAQPLYRLRLEKVGAVSVLPYESENEDKVIFVSQMNPPRILEIDVSEQDRPPFVTRTYRLGGSDENQFYFMDMLDGNSEYILAQIVNIRSSTPLIRVYRRKSEQYSSVYLDIPLGDFTDSGLFLKFVHYIQNCFVLKSSNSFQIYKIQPTFLELNAWAGTSQRINTPTLRLNLTLTAKNSSFYAITTDINVLVIDENNVNTMSMMNGGTGQQSVQMKYTCGQPDLDGGGYIDSYFSGKKNKLAISNLTEGSEFFTLSKVDLKYIKAKVFSGDQCQYSQLVRFQERSFTNIDQQTRECFACSTFNGTSVSFIDLEESLLHPIPDFQLPESNILEFHYELKKNNFFILSDQSAKTQNKAAILHMYRLYNIFTWELSINLNQQIPDFENFLFRDHDAMYFDAKLQQGILISQPNITSQVFSSKIISQRLAIFEIVENSKVESPFRIRGYIDYDFQQFGRLMDKDLIVKHARLDSNGFFWVLLTNGTLFIYEQVAPLHKVDPNYDQNKYQNLQLIRQYQRINLVEFENRRMQRQNESINNFIIKGSKLVVFQGDNTTILHEYDLTSFELLKSMVLPIYIDQKEQFDLNEQLKYVISTTTDRVTYANLRDYLFVLYQVFQNGISRGFRFYIYDISKPRHNSLLMRQKITINDPNIIDSDPLEIDPQFIRIQLLDKNEDVISVILNINKQTIVQFEFEHNTRLRLNQTKIDVLYERCKKEDGGLDFQLTVYPDDNVNEKVNFTIHAENKGLLITKQLDLQNMTLQVMENSLKSNNPLKTAKYTLLSNFHGQNMNFSFSCKNETFFQDQDLGFNNIAEICDDLQLQQQVYDQNFTIDFLSSKNPALGFYVIQPYLVFIDATMLRVYYLDYQQYESIELKYLFPFMFDHNIQGDQLPSFYKFKLLDIPDQQDPSKSSYYLMCINTANQISVARLIVVDSDDTLKKYSHLLYSSNYQKFNHISQPNRCLLIQKSFQFTTAYSYIDKVEPYLIDPSIPDYLGAIIVYDNPNELDMSSRIEQYVFDMRENMKQTVSITRNFTMKSIFDGRLNLNVFKATAIAFLPELKVLVIALKDIGLMFYTIDHQKIIKIERLRSMMKLNSLIIDYVIPSAENHFKLLTRNNGVLLISYPLDNLQTSDIYQLYNDIPQIEQTSINEKDSSTAYKRLLLTTGKYGFAYSYQPDLTNGIYNLRYLKFFSFSVDNKTKALGKFPLAEGVSNCDYLQTLKKIDFLKQYLPNVTDESMVVALLCDSTMKIVAYNYHPSLKINLQDQYQMELSQTMIELQSKNDVSEEKYNLLITLMSQERGISQYFYFGFVVVIGFVMLGVQIFIKDQQSNQGEDKKNKKAKPKNN